MRTSLFDYVLEPRRIAQHPPRERDGARMLVVRDAELRHTAVQEFPELVPEGALVVLNDTRVMRARLLGKRPETGGEVEILLMARMGAPQGREELWRAIGRASKPLRVGQRILADELSLEVTANEEGDLTMRVSAPESVDASLERFGHVPLPPYVRRPDTAEDRDRYQTVFARASGSVAAPTAGLHLTEESLARLGARGVRIGFVTLHVGLGTFRPVTVSDLDDHPMHAERVTVGSDLVREVRQARERRAPVVAVGTTVVRALEAARAPDDPRQITPMSGETRLLIQPGYRFGPVDALLTNFHAPRSTLLALVCAFGGTERVLAAYAAALASDYRFLSYGDAMWLGERA